MENQPSFLDRIFHLRENGTTVRTEILAGDYDVYDYGLHSGRQPDDHERRRHG